MQKAVYLEPSTSNITRVLSIAPVEAATVSPNGFTYTAIENYVDPPALVSPLDKHYPMYNKVTGEFYWVTVGYQNTATESLLEVENLKQAVSTLQSEKDSLQEVVDALLLESLGGETIG